MRDCFKHLIFLTQSNFINYRISPALLWGWGKLESEKDINFSKVTGNPDPVCELSYSTVGLTTDQPNDSTNAHITNVWWAYLPRQCWCNLGHSYSPFLTALFISVCCIETGDIFWSSTVLFFYPLFLFYPESLTFFSCAKISKVIQCILVCLLFTFVIENYIW